MAVPEIIQEASRILEMAIPTSCRTSKTLLCLIVSNLYLHGLVMLAIVSLSAIAGPTFASVLYLHCLVMLAFVSLSSFIPTFAQFFDTNYLVGGLGMFAYLAFPFIFMYYFGKNEYKRELALLLIFTIYSSSAVGFTCALLNGRVVMESAILTAVAVMSLTLFTFRAARKRPDSTIPTRIIFADSTIPTRIILAGIVLLLVFILVLQVLLFVIMESAILTSVAVMSLILFTLWAARKRGGDYTIAARIILAGIVILLTIPTRSIFYGIVILLVLILVQIILRLEKLQIMMYDH